MDYRVFFIKVAMETTQSNQIPVAVKKLQGEKENVQSLSQSNVIYLKINVTNIIATSY